mgnify:FL=1
MQYNQKINQKEILEKAEMNKFGFIVLAIIVAIAATQEISNYKFNQAFKAQKAQRFNNTASIHVASKPQNMTRPSRPPRNPFRQIANWFSGKNSQKTEDEQLEVLYDVNVEGIEDFLSASKESNGNKTFLHSSNKRNRTNKPLTERSD